MNLNIEKSTSYTVDEIYNIEVETIQFLAEPLLMATAPNNVDILNTHVSVANQLLQQNDNGERRIILDMVVEIIYIAATPQNVVDVTQILDVVDTHQLAMALNVPSLSASYGPKDATLKLQSCDSSSSTKTAADKGLIATTVFLAIGLGTLASVVLYVSGASCSVSACKSWFINCLFEEVVTGDGGGGYAEDEDVDFDDLDKNSNNNKDSGDKCFQVHTYPDEESVSMSSVSLAMLTNPSGILGANHHVDENCNPAAGLGIKTPGRGSSGGAGDHHSELLETPMSQQQHQPLGITSIRKMPLQQVQQQHHYYYHEKHQQQQLQPSDASLQGGGGGGGEDNSNGGGLVNMIMQRLNLNENNNKP
jgi:hypothetical protein